MTFEYPDEASRHAWGERMEALAPAHAYNGPGWDKTWTTRDSMWTLHIDTTTLVLTVEGSRGSWTFHHPSADYVQGLLGHLGAI